MDADEGERVETAPFAWYSDRLLTLDLRRPPVAGAPVILYLHGGAWVLGHRTDHPRRLDSLAAAGLTVASIDYRLATDAPFPAQRADIEAAAEWIVINGLAPDPSQILLMGASAGAHLAALSALTSRYRFGGVVGLFGRYDLTSQADDIQPAPGLPVPAEILANELPAGFETAAARVAALAGLEETDVDDDVLARLSPVSRLAAGSPPLFLVHGTSDALVHHDHSVSFARRADAHGIRSEVTLLPGADHEDPVFDGPDLAAKIAQFARTVTSRDR